MSKATGGGKLQDVDVIRDALGPHFRVTVLYAERSVQYNLPRVDVQIFVQDNELTTDLLRFARHNGFVSNQEQYHPFKIVSRFDFVIAKHEYARCLLQEYRDKPQLRCASCKFPKAIHYRRHHDFIPDQVQLHFKIYSTRFTSPTPGPTPVVRIKNFRRAVHIGGKSGWKGTVKLLRCYINNPDLGTLTVKIHKETDTKDGNPAWSMCDHEPDKKECDRVLMECVAGKHPHVRVIAGFVDDVTSLYQEHGLHICPSVAEGFAQYINLARYHGNVIITTAKPPMNLLVEHGRTGFTIPVTNTGEYHGFGDWVADWKCADMVAAIRQVQKMSTKQLNRVGEAAHQAFMRDDQYFRTKLPQVVHKVMQRGHHSAYSVSTRADGSAVSSHHRGSQ